MKVTAIVPEELIQNVQKKTGEKTVTKSIIKALTEWNKLEEIKELNYRVSKKPLQFEGGFDAFVLRDKNRQL
jgi:hypothetical protein